MIIDTSKLHELNSDEIKYLLKIINREYSSRKIKRPKTVPNKVDVRKYWIYALLLKNNKYYVGITSQKIENRYQQHADGTGSRWTKQHRPLGILEHRYLGVLTKSEAAKFENDLTHDYIGKYGADNVRGGDLCHVSQKLFDMHYQASYRKLMSARNSHIIP